MSRIRIKFCGITREEDALLAADLGVDALGFVFSRRSGRFIEPEQAALICRRLPPMVSKVALFMDDDPAWIRAVLSAFPPHLLQFHGSENALDCAATGFPYIKAVPMASITDVASYATAYPEAAALLLDAHVVGEPGGQGTRFDWSRRVQVAQALILAGGLDAGNVAEAIRCMRPFAVDVSSGIEASAGVKDPARMRAFVEAVRGVEHER
ncbi:MAG: phosphoribosylanthranilate isomerase [Gammaproteobacteria bacterium]|nr:MAG: phosphoribosylanthranilate isomerase [Gammaproteobacteria bacterium]